MREFWGFVRAVSLHWVALATGTVLSLAGLVHEQYAADPVPRWAFLSCAGACLLAACFLAWRDEHRARLDAAVAVPSLDLQAAAQLVEAQKRIAQLEREQARMAPRRLTPQEVEAILAVLRNRAIPEVWLRFGYYVSSGNNGELAFDLAETFSRAGWQAVAGDVEVAGERKVGVSIEGFTQQARALVAEALGAADLKVTATESGDADGPMHVMIGTI